MASGLARGERVTTPYGVGEVVWSPCVAGRSLVHGDTSYGQTGVQS